MDEWGFILLVIFYCFLFCEDVVFFLKLNVFFVVEFGVKGGEGEVVGVVEIVDFGEIGLFFVVE